MVDKTTLLRMHIGKMTSAGKPMMKKTIAITILALTAVTLSACSTVKGLGRDIESVGEAGDRAM